ncbi:vesicle transport through interaction with t-SNAREs homolog 1B isoform X3 [Caretta caretta]|uniref:vesicle transport through interaction with t-SNAREs homolog 1B isoform X3 n=1 Tax=Caretta caretta TaxID=8467 RepID=UPI002095F123|nr:vesicle transport through interaction with t-SNAREs homolog 1B isoform X3 [Caretta caretta]
MAGLGSSSSEHFERLHEIFRGLQAELRGVPERLRGSAAGEWGRGKESETDWGCIAPLPAAEEKKKLIREFDEKQQEANETLREMEEELKYAPVSFRNQMMNRIRTYKRDLAMFQREIKSTDLGLGLGSRGDTKYGIYSMENEQSLVNTSENLSKTRKILRSMSKRIMTNKLLLSVIIILELAILGGVVYYKFFRKS